MDDIISAVWNYSWRNTYGKIVSIQKECLHVFMDNWNVKVRKELKREHLQRGRNRGAEHRRHLIKRRLIGKVFDKEIVAILRQH